MREILKEVREAFTGAREAFTGREKRLLAQVGFTRAREGIFCVREGDICQGQSTTYSVLYLLTQSLFMMQVWSVSTCHQIMVQPGSN